MSERLKARVKYCFGSGSAVDRGIFILPSSDDYAVQKYVSVRSQQVISTVLIALVFIFNLVGLRLAVYTNDVCEGAGQIFTALLLLSGLVSFLMCGCSHHSVSR